MFLMQCSGQAEKKRFSLGENFQIETERLAMDSPVAATR